MLGAAGTLVGLFVSLWVVSVIVRDASIVDSAWGPAFAMVALSGAVLGVGSDRAWYTLGLVCVWGLRLGLHIFLRNHGRGEDRRYRAMRAAAGDRFWWSSLFTVYLLQAAIAWVVSLPVQAIAWSKGSPFGVLDLVGAALVLIGVAFETVADAQLARFGREPSNRDRVMDRGLWGWSRHPNYFGDAVVWWGLGVLALSTGLVWTLIGPAVMTLFLLRVSGVTLLEKTIGERRPGYAAYVARTSAFIPWPPKRRS